MTNKMVDNAETVKCEGNKFFENGQYKEAIKRYEQASQIDPTVPTYFSNAAACWQKLGKYEKMAEAARNSIKADRNFVKGYFRLATAQKNLNQLVECMTTLENGLSVDPSNADMTQMKNEIIQLQDEQEQVAQHIAKAEEQIHNGDIAAAKKTLELASTLDAGNTDIGRMLATVKSIFDHLEAKHKANRASTNIQIQEKPETWSDCDDILVEVPAEDDQYWQVAARLQETMADAHLAKVWRIQNTRQWNNYSFQKDRLSVNNIKHNERSVWHGTSRTDPAVIYNDKLDGFMTQVSKEGYWGRGTYFADKSLYSHTYAHKPHLASSTERSGAIDGDCELFLTKLLVGNEVLMNRDESSAKATECKALTVPPTDPKTGMKYNTVTGHADGSQVWIVYENFRAYPDYLVRYYRGAQDLKRTPYKNKQEAMKNVAKARTSGNAPGCPDDSGIIWEFEDNDGWKAYSDPHQVAIERAYQSFAVTKVSKVSTVRISTSEWEYELDVVSMVQTNVKHDANKKRNVRRRLPGLVAKTNIAGCPADTNLDSGVIWEFMDDDDWKPYTVVHQATIESAYQSFTVTKVSKVSTVRISTSAWEYEVDVVSMIQTNVKHDANKKRDVRRRITGDGAAGKGMQTTGSWLKFWK